jgi:hypothetical protein
MCVSNEDRPPVAIDSRHATPTPTGFAEIVSDDFPVLHLLLAILRCYERIARNFGSSTVMEKRLT